jgi:hypothetical protein
MSETAEVMADAFAAEANTVPVVNVSGVDAQTATEPEVRPGKTQKFYTEDDLAKVRAQEKNKLYPELESLRGEVLELKKEKEAKDAAKAQQRAEEEAALRAKQEDELSAKDLLKLKEQEWKEQLEHERQERERAIALLEQEKAFADLQQYRQQRLEQERDNIVPELLDLVHGNSREELDASLNDLQQRSARILESAQQALVNARKEMPGTRATLPPAGPLETNSEQRQFTADEIASMPMNEYAKYRSRLLSDRAQGKTSGMFGSK